MNQSILISLTFNNLQEEALLKFINKVLSKMKNDDRFNAFYHEITQLELYFNDWKDAILAAREGGRAEFYQKNDKQRMMLKLCTEIAMEIDKLAQKDIEFIYDAGFQPKIKTTETNQKVIDPKPTGYQSHLF